MKSVAKTFDGKFKVGDLVELNRLAVGIGMSDKPYIVKDIVCDSFGCVLLKKPDGFGYGEQYLQLSS